jgi:outer membrane immunogenic protein
MRMMKFALLTSLSAFALGAPALAADMGVPMKAPMAAPPPVPVVNWTGCYVDGGAGYGLWNIDHFGENTSGTTVTATSTSGGRGWLGTVGGGCDYQFSPGSGWGNWVIGAFGDYEFMDLHKNFQGSFGPFVGEEKESSAWAVGGRIGYLVTPNVFTYWNGGYTQTHFDQVNFSLTFNGAPTAFIGSHTYNGWFLGGGTEISLSGLFGMPLPAGLFWRSEYRYSSFNSANLAIFSPGGVPLGISENTRPYVQTITTALVWRFGWLGR